MAKTQKPINPLRVAGKMLKSSISKTKEGLNKKKTTYNSTNAAAGVASRAGGVRTITDAKVTGSKQKGIEGLKAKKKSGEMSRAEANAKIKALKGKVPTGQNVTVTGKKQPVKKTYGESKTIHFSEVPKNPKASPSPYKSTYYTNQKSIPTDSAKFMQQMQSTNPAAYKSAMKFMTTQQAKNPGVRFEFGGTRVGQVESAINYARKGETAKYNPKTKNYLYSSPKISTVLPNKKKKK